MNGDTTGGEILVAVWPKHGLRSDLRVPNLKYKKISWGSLPPDPPSLKRTLIPHLNGRTRASSSSGDIQFGLPAMRHLRAGRGVATQKFSGAICAPMAEPPFLNF